MGKTFFADAADRYVRSNAATLEWMLGRPRLRGVYLNTKLDPLTARDYGPGDGLRGPDYLYGWIQGRGLEALVTHTAWLETRDPDLAQTLDAAARVLYGALADLVRADGHGYFCYDADLKPVRRTEEGGTVAQSRVPDIYTYTDAFIAKGLVAAGARFADARLAEHRAYLARVVQAIEDRRFQMDEHRPIAHETIAGEPDDFGPRMILLGAAGMLGRAGLVEDCGFADRFIAHVIETHLDPGSGLLRNVAGEDACNVGHGIEFVGFALDHLSDMADPELVKTLEAILLSSFSLGFAGPGITLGVSVQSGKPTSPYCPWWSLPETIRSAALVYRHTQNPAVLDIWAKADEAFFAQYWRQTPPIAYQCRTIEGPVDYVPATPDLDPGYHTGLSLLAAADIAQHLTLDEERYS